MEAAETRERLDDLAVAAIAAGMEGVEVSLPADRFITLNGLRFHYLDWDHPDARTILFLHGSRLTAHTFDLVCMSLRQQLHCISVVAAAAAACFAGCGSKRTANGAGSTTARDSLGDRQKMARPAPLTCVLPWAASPARPWFCAALAAICLRTRMPRPWSGFCRTA